MAGWHIGKARVSLGAASGFLFVWSSHAAIVGDGKDMRTYEQYAREHNMSSEAVYKKFAATGRIVCNGVVGTAQVIEDKKSNRHNLLVSALHVFYNNDMSPHGDLSRCFFRPILGPHVFGPSIFVQPSSLKYERVREIDEAEPETDHITFRLQSDVPGVKPYKVLSTDGLSMNYFTTLQFANIAALSAVFGDQSKRPPLVVEGTLMGAYGIGRPRYFQASTSAGGGMSGSGIFIERDHELFMIGIVSGSANISRNGTARGWYNYTSGPLIEGPFAHDIAEE
jgi:hypothetical protein